VPNYNDLSSSIIHTYTHTALLSSVVVNIDKDGNLRWSLTCTEIHVLTQIHRTLTKTRSAECKILKLTLSAFTLRVLHNTHLCLQGTTQQSTFTET